MDTKQKDKKYLIQNYNRFDLEIVSGKGAVCFDAEGNGYIDFTSGIGVNSLGYAPDELIDAATNQLKKVQHVSNLFYSQPATELAETVCKMTGYDKAFFCNSGAEANEAAIKIMRKYSSDKYGEGRGTIITLKNSFHGRTLTTLTATGQDAMHRHFAPFTPGFVYVDANDIDGFLSSVDGSVCGVILEPIQGEGGVNMLSQSFVDAVFDHCQKNDILLAADEVQTGIMRTGKLLATEHFGIKPDIVTLAKGLGGGLPIGAVLASKKVSGVFGFGDHGTTFGANPVVTAGALAVLKTVAALDGHVKKLSDLFVKKLTAEGFAVSGKGLMLGISMPSGVLAADVAKKCIQNGLLVLTAKDKVRLLPPLNIDTAHAEKGLDILINVIKGA